MNWAANIFAFLFYAVMLASIAGLAWMYWIGNHKDKWLERRRRGLCARCGYDLRASRHKCPECGMAISELH